MGCDLEKLWILEADLATGHGVAQLSLIVDEGHNAQIGLDEQGSLKDQHTISPTRNGVLLMCFLHCLHQLGPEVVQLGTVEGKEHETRTPLQSDCFSHSLPI